MFEWFSCAPFRTRARIGSVEHEVDVKRCWKDGRDLVLKSQCTCYSDEECEFKEIHSEVTEQKPDVFKEGCLVEYCPPPKHGDTSFVVDKKP